MDITFNSKDALLVSDLQYDFLPNGSLAVPEGDKIIPVINKLITAAKAKHATIIASRDWHPANHISFHEQGGPWPPHCVKNTHGAQFHKDIEFPADTIIVNKAFKQDQEAYSAFSAETDDGLALTDVLKAHHIKRVFIVGLCLDYCVKASSLDSIKQGFETIVVLDATRAIDQKDGLESVRVLSSFGVQFI